MLAWKSRAFVRGKKRGEGGMAAVCSQAPAGREVGRKVAPDGALEKS